MLKYGSMILIYYYKKDFETQKAERWFSERRIPVQKMDLARKKLSNRELDVFCRDVGLDAIIDQESKAWKECPARYTANAEMKMAALVSDPRLLKLPIVRNGSRVTIGYQPEIWTDWGMP